jgi:V/A-type H+-transporting ATPase subunit E
VSISGNPEKLANEAIKRALESYDSLLKDAEGAAEKLITSSYSEAERRLRSTIESKAAELEEKLRSDQAAADLQVRFREEEVKSKAIDDVIDEVMSRLRRDRGEWYIKYVQSALRDLEAEAKDHGGFVVMANRDDRELVAGLLKDLKDLELSDESVNIVGGIIAVSKDGSVRVDYSIDQFISENLPSLRGVASRALFGK